MLTETSRDFAAIWERWRTWWLLAYQDILLRYRRSILGPFWISLTMTTMVIALTYLYASIFSQPYQDTLKYIASGIVAWWLLASFATEGAGALIEAEGHLKSVRIPIPVIAGRVVARNMIVFGHNLLVTAVVLVLFGYQPSFATLLVIPALALYVVIGFGVTITLAPLALRYRDIQQAVNNIMQAAFFLTPIFWDPRKADNVRPFVSEINPFHHMIEIVRGPLLGYAPTAVNWGVSIGVAVLMGATALFAVNVSRKRVSLWL